MAFILNGKEYDNKNIYHNYKNSYDISGNQYFHINNWNTLVQNKNNNLYTKSNLDTISIRGGAIWLNVKGDLCYRLSTNDDIHIATANKISLVFNNLWGMNVEIREIQKKAPKNVPSGINFPINQILISELLLIKDEYFRPDILSEFYKGEDDFFYRNIFKPTMYFTSPSQPRPGLDNHKLIILQYIYYISDYQIERFRYILNWLAAFFKNLTKKSNIPLVLIGGKTSGKEILFDEIITPLFRREYCLKIDDDMLETNNTTDIIKNKLFYNIDNITNLKNKKIQLILKNIINTDIRKVNKDSLYLWQTLITIDEPYIPYINSDDNTYSIFKIGKDIEDIYIPQDFNQNNNFQNKLSKNTLINLIRQDIPKFALILKSHVVDYDQVSQPFQNDDKKFIFKNIDDKVISFGNAIMKANKNYFITIKYKDDILYQEIMEDFDNKKVKQKNLLKSFVLLYPEEAKLHSRTLMVKLRAIKNSNGFFETNALEIGPAGFKYFDIIE